MKLKALGILLFVPIFVFIVAVTMTDKNFQNKPVDSSKDAYPKVTNKENVMPPNIKLNITVDYFAKVKTTAGDFKIKLNALDTLLTTSNFIYLAKIGFFEDIVFHRVIKDFMIQSGDPRGDGTGGPGYSFNDEPFEQEYVRGAVAMANSGKNTNGSQFFIMHKDNLQMPKNYTIFGKVVEGIETIDKIAEAPVQDNGYGEMSKPVEPVKIISVEITEE